MMEFLTHSLIPCSMVSLSSFLLSNCSGLSIDDTLTASPSTASHTHTHTHTHTHRANRISTYTVVAGKRLSHLFQLSELRRIPGLAVQRKVEVPVCQWQLLRSESHSQGQSLFQICRQHSDQLCLDQCSTLDSIPPYTSEWNRDTPNLNKWKRSSKQKVSHFPKGAPCDNVWPRRTDIYMYTPTLS